MQRRRSLEANETLHDVWPPGGCTIYVFRGSCLLTEFCEVHARFPLRRSLAFSYIGSITARHSSSERLPKFAACYKEWNCTTFAEGASAHSAGRPSRWALAHILVLSFSPRIGLYQTVADWMSSILPHMRWP